MRGINQFQERLEGHHGWERFSIHIGIGF
jgi:hypothetical protein